MRIPVTYETFSTEQLLEALETAGRTPDRELITACLDRRDDLVSGLLEMLDLDDDDWDEEDPRWYRVIHAGLFLIAFREERALPIYARLFRDEEQENLLEWFGERRFSHYGAPALDMLADLLRDRNAWVWSRTTAALELEAIAKRYPETRDRIVEILRLRLPRVDEDGEFVIPPMPDEDQVVLWTWILLALAHLNDTASQAQGVALYRDGWVDEAIMGDEGDYLNIFGSIQRTLEPFDLVTFYHPPARPPFSYDASDPYESREPAQAVVERGTFVREEKKVGRNDPCPCGSGRKYKRCCGKN